jgi:uncharacterized membrane protein YidH (DUF202 family)
VDGRSRYTERTALAWTRTALALLGAVLLAVRLSIDRLGAIAVTFVLVALPLAVAVLVAAGRRYRAAHRGDRARLDGRLPGGVALLVVVLAAVELGYVLRG